MPGEGSHSYAAARRREFPPGSRQPTLCTQWSLGRFGCQIPPERGDVPTQRRQGTQGRNVPGGVHRTPWGTPTQAWGASRVPSGSRAVEGERKVRGVARTGNHQRNSVGCSHRGVVSPSRGSVPWGACHSNCIEASDVNATHLYRNGTRAGVCGEVNAIYAQRIGDALADGNGPIPHGAIDLPRDGQLIGQWIENPHVTPPLYRRSEEHTSELQSPLKL